VSPLFGVCRVGALPLCITPIGRMRPSIGRVARYTNTGSAAGQARTSQRLRGCGRTVVRVKRRVLLAMLATMRPSSSGAGRLTSGYVVRGARPTGVASRQRHRRAVVRPTSMTDRRKPAGSKGFWRGCETNWSHAPTGRCGTGASILRGWVNYFRIGNAARCFACAPCKEDEQRPRVPSTTRLSSGPGQQVGFWRGARGLGRSLVPRLRAATLPEPELRQAKLVPALHSDCSERAACYWMGFR